MNAQQILNAVTVALNTAKAQNPPLRVAVSTIAENITLRVDTYHAAEGPGVSATAAMTFGTGKTATIVICTLQSGPDVARQRNATLETLLPALLLAEFSQLSIGDQHQFDAMRAAVNAALQSGNVTLAKSIIATTTLTAPSLLAAQAALVALFP